MSAEKFVYVIYIRTTPEKLWEALTSPALAQSYWCGCRIESVWEAGSPWRLMIPDGRVGDAGVIVEIDKPRRLVLRWRNEFIPEMRAEGVSRCTWELEPAGDMVKLTITHESDKTGSKLIQSVSTGWPVILSSLKSLLETGDALEATKQWPKGV
jgi:uncharacterized protein YndB with AHSA1/START domain